MGGNTRLTHFRRPAAMTEIGALQPMAAGFAAGSDLAGTSGAGIARNCPRTDLPASPSNYRFTKGYPCHAAN
jgi:hypothetical protein